MMTALHKIAERKIEQALADGEFQDLSHWKNKPLPKDNMEHVPADLRLAYRMLKNAGYLPEELVLRKKIRRTEELLATVTEEKEKLHCMKKLDLLKIKLEKYRGRPLQITEDSTYYSKVVDRV